MNDIIYGTDKNKKVTPLMVRDAVVVCFFNAHCEDTGVSVDDKESNRIYCRELVKKAFKDTNGDFENPTKENIMSVLGKLAEFSKNFRDPSIVQKHYGEIMELMKKLN